MSYDYKQGERETDQHYIERIVARCKAIERSIGGEAAQESWIAVSDQKPPDGISVLAAIDGRVIKTAWHWGEFIMPSKAQPTHWMPLPKPPIASYVSPMDKDGA